MRRLACCLSLLTFILGCLHSVSEPRTSWPITTYVTAAGAIIDEGNVPLPFDTTLTGTLAPRSPASCLLGETQYAISYPGGATRVKVEVSVASRSKLCMWVLPRASGNV